MLTINLKTPYMLLDCFTDMSERRTNKILLRRMTAMYESLSLAIAICDTLSDIVNVERVIDRDMAKYRHVKGAEWYNCELRKEVTFRTAQIIKADRAELDEVNDIVQLVKG